MVKTIADAKYLQGAYRLNLQNPIHLLQYNFPGGNNFSFAVDQLNEV